MMLLNLLRLLAQNSNSKQMMLLKRLKNYYQPLKVKCMGLLRSHEMPLLELQKMLILSPWITNS